MDSVLQRTGFICADRPNWSSPVTETHEFRTATIPTRSGFRFPAALNQKPRVQVQYKSDATGLRAQRSFLDRHLLPTEDKWVVPLYWRALDLTATPVSGATTLTVSSVPDWLKVGSSIVIQDADRTEAVEVQSIADPTITLTGAVGSTYSGATAYLGMVARPDEETKFSALISAHMGTTTAMTADPVLLPDWPTSYWPDIEQEVYKGRPVALFDPNWRQDVKIEVQRPVEVLDFGRSAISSSTLREHSDVEFGFSFSGMTAADVERMFAFFAWARGRQGLFWSPIPTTALEGCSGTAAATTFTTSTYDIQFLTSYDMLGHLLLTWPDGTRQAVEVVSAVSDPAGALVTITEPLSADLTSTCRVQWLLLCRFATDAMDVKWVTDSVAETAILLRGQHKGMADIDTGPLA